MWPDMPDSPVKYRRNSGFNPADFGLSLFS